MTQANPSPTISVLAEIPEDLQLQLQAFIDSNQEWDCDRVFVVAIAHFLMTQTHSEGDRSVPAREYLNALWRTAP